MKPATTNESIHRICNAIEHHISAGEATAAYIQIPSFASLEATLLDAGEATAAADAAGEATAAPLSLLRFSLERAQE